MVSITKLVHHRIYFHKNWICHTFDEAAVCKYLRHHKWSGITYIVGNTGGVCITNITICWYKNQVLSIYISVIKWNDLFIISTIYVIQIIFKLILQEFAIQLPWKKKCASKICKIGNNSKPFNCLKLALLPGAKRILNKHQQTWFCFCFCFCFFFLVIKNKDGTLPRCFHNVNTT